MREYTQPDTYAGAIKELRERVDSIERAAQVPATSDHRVSITATSFPSPPYRPPAPVTVTDLWAEASTAVSADTVYALKRDGTSVGTVTISSGSTTGMASIGPLAFDVYNVATITRTSGTADATVQAIGTSQHPITPSLAGPGAAALAYGVWTLTSAYSVGNDVSPVETVTADWTQVLNSDTNVFTSISGSVNGGQMFTAQPGTFFVSAGVEWAVNHSGARSQHLTFGGDGLTSQTIGHDTTAPPHFSTASECCRMPVGAGIIKSTGTWGVALAVGQTSGGALTLMSTTSTFISVVKIA